MTQNSLGILQKAAEISTAGDCSLLNSNAISIIQANKAGNVVLDNMKVGMQRMNMSASHISYS